MTLLLQHGRPPRASTRRKMRGQHAWKRANSIGGSRGRPANF